MPTFRAKGKISLGKSRKVRRGARRTRKLRVSKAVKSYVNRTISRRAENKYKDVELGFKAFYQSIDNSSVQSLMPTIPQGTSQSTRIGNVIKVKRLKLGFKVFLSNLGSAYFPTYVDVYIFKLKDKNINGGAPTALNMQNFLENDSSSEAYNGTQFSSMRQLNSDLFKQCIHKRINLFTPLSQQNSILANLNPMFHTSFILTKYVKKTLMFDDGQSNVPTNDNLYIAVGASQANGDSVFLSSGSYACLAEYQYEDM